GPLSRRAGDADAADRACRGRSAGVRLRRCCLLYSGSPAFEVRWLTASRSAGTARESRAFISSPLEETRGAEGAASHQGVVRRPRRYLSSRCSFPGCRTVAVEKGGGATHDKGKTDRPDRAAGRRGGAG